MTLDEAKKVARVVETAEGGCGGCVNEALRDLNKAFPEFTWWLIHPKGASDPSIEVTPRRKKPAPGYAPIFCGR